MSVIKLKPLSQAVQGILMAGVLSIATLATAQLQANETIVSKQYNITAGALDQVLTQFAVQAGISLAFDQATIKQLHSKGLHGSYSVETGLNELLATQPYQIEQTQSGYILVRKTQNLQPVRDMGQLKTIDVTATKNQTNDNQITQLPVMIITAENNSSYTVGNTNSTTKMDLSLRETPQTVTVFTQQLLEDKALTKIEQVLNHTPGVSMVGDSSEGSQIFVRGFALNNSVQTNGMGSGSASGSTNMFSQAIDTALAESIEVIKGANGITSGSGEPSATVNMTLKRPTAAPQSQISVSAGSWNNYRAEADVSGALNNDESLRGRAVIVQQSKDYFVDNYHVDKTIIYGVLEKDVLDHGTFSLFADYQRSYTDGIFTYDTMPAFYSDGTPLQLDRSFSTGQKWAKSDIDRYSIMPEFQYQFNDDWNIKAQYRFTHAEADRTTFYAGNFIDKATGKFVSRWEPAPYATLSLRDSDNHTAELYTSGKFNLFNRQHEIIFGGNYIHDIYTGEGYRTDNLADYYLSSGDISEPVMRTTPSSKANKETMKQSGLFTTLRLNPSDRLKLMLGARISNWEYYSTAKPVPVEAKNEVIPYYGFVFDINNFVSMYSSYTSIFLPQNYYVEGGKIISPIIGSTVEGGFKFAFFDNQLNASIATYQTKKDKDIVWDRYDSALQAWIVKAGAPIKTTGYELEISGQVTPNWNLSGGYTNNKVNNNQGKPRMTHVPEDTFKIFTDYNLDSIVSGLRIGGGIRWQSDTYYDSDISLDGTTTHKARQTQPAYTLVDLFATYQINQNYYLSLNINNLLDETYNRSMWGYSDFGEPRNYLVTLRAKY